MDKFVSFPKGNEGYVLLQQYLSGTVVLQLFLITCGIYGLLQGIRGRKINFTALFFGAALGFMASTVIQMILNWDVTPLRTAALMLNPKSSNISLRSVLFYIVNALFSYLLWPFYTSLCIYLGRFTAKLMSD